MANEYIEREALIRYAERQRIVIRDGTSVAEAMRIQGNVFRRCVEVIPTADVVEVKHGEWIEDGYAKKPCVCSYCGEEARYISRFEETFDYDWEENLQSTGYEEIREYIRTPYCPNCGAKMDGTPKERGGGEVSYDISFKVKIEGVDRYVEIGDCYAHTTWNVREMIVKSTGLEWRNEANNGFCKDIIPCIEKGYNELTYNPEKYKKYEAKNGWGTVESTREFFGEILKSWRDLKRYEENDLLDIVTFWIE